MQMSAHRRQSPVLYFPHGGGPLPLLGDPAHANMVNFLTAITPTLDEPSAILVISAHWEEREPTITSGEHPALFYDYYGFPEESYHIQYPAPGHPVLAQDMAQMLQQHGIEVRLDADRGFDHGLFVPLKIMYPDAHIPCIQLSLIAGLDPASHIRLGQALTALRDRNVLILGSGFSFHNMREFFSSRPGAPDARNDAFQQWLLETCTTEGVSSDERQKRLTAWKDAPHARYCHPREEHLMPLHVCYGIAGTHATAAFDGEILGKRSVALLW